MKYDEKHQKKIEIALQLLNKNLPKILAVIVFGSFATEYERADSDLDLAIILEDYQEAIDQVHLWNLAQKIAIALAMDVDVINLRDSSVVFNYQVLTTGTTVYCSDEIKFARYDSLMTSMYLRFQEERKEILADIEKGIYYA